MYRWEFKVKSQKKKKNTQQIREDWSQQLEHQQVPKRGTEPSVRKCKHSLLACHIRCKRSMETFRTYDTLVAGIMEHPILIFST